MSVSYVEIPSFFCCEKPSARARHVICGKTGAFALVIAFAYCQNCDRVEFTPRGLDILCRVWGALVEALHLAIGGRR